MTGTLGVGGSPLLVAFGGEVARFCELVRSLSSRFRVAIFELGLLYSNVERHTFVWEEQ